MLYTFIRFGIFFFFCPSWRSIKLNANPSPVSVSSSGAVGNGQVFLLKFFFLFWLLPSLSGTLWSCHSTLSQKNLGRNPAATVVMGRCTAPWLPCSQRWWVTMSWHVQCIYLYVCKCMCMQAKKCLGVVHVDMAGLNAFAQLAILHMHVRWKIRALCALIGGWRPIKDQPICTGNVGLLSLWLSLLDGLLVAYVDVSRLLSHRCCSALILHNAFTSLHVSSLKSPTAVSSFVCSSSHVRLHI